MLKSNLLFGHLKMLRSNLQLKNRTNNGKLSEITYTTNIKWKSHQREVCISCTVNPLTCNFFSFQPFFLISFDFNYIQFECNDSAAFMLVVWINLTFWQTFSFVPQVIKVLNSKKRNIRQVPNTTTQDLCGNKRLCSGMYQFLGISSKYFEIKRIL